MVSYSIITQPSGREGDQHLGGQVEQPHAHLDKGEKGEGRHARQRGGEVAQPHAHIAADKEKQPQREAAAPPPQEREAKALATSWEK